MGTPGLLPLIAVHARAHVCVCGRGGTWLSIRSGGTVIRSRIATRAESAWELCPGDSVARDGGTSREACRWLGWDMRTRGPRDRSEKNGLRGGGHSPLRGGEVVVRLICQEKPALGFRLLWLHIGLSTSVRILRPFPGPFPVNAHQAQPQALGVPHRLLRAQTGPVASLTWVHRPTTTHRGRCAD